MMDVFIEVLFLKAVIVSQAHATHTHIHTQVCGVPVSATA